MIYHIAKNGMVFNHAVIVKQSKIFRNNFKLIKINYSSNYLKVVQYIDNIS